MRLPQILILLFVCSLLLREYSPLRSAPRPAPGRNVIAIAAGSTEKVYADDLSIQVMHADARDGNPMLRFIAAAGNIHTGSQTTVSFACLPEYATKQNFSDVHVAQSVICQGAGKALKVKFLGLFDGKARFETVPTPMIFERALYVQRDHSAAVSDSDLTLTVKDIRYEANQDQGVDATGTRSISVDYSVQRASGASAQCTAHIGESQVFDHAFNVRLTAVEPLQAEFEVTGIPLDEGNSAPANCNSATMTQATTRQ